MENTRQSIISKKLWMIFILFTVILIIAATKIQAQEASDKGLTPTERHFIGVEKAPETAQLFEARTYVSIPGDTIPYRLLKPLVYDPQKKYALVVCLSGSGGRGTDNVKQIAGCWPAQVLSRQENRKKYPCFLFVPQCPPGADWGASFSERQKEQWVQAGYPLRPSIESFVFAIISLLEKEFSIDPDRRYVTGQSMGGTGSWHYILTYQQMFAAAIPICGGADPDLGQMIIDTPIWAFHGQKDDIAPVDLSRDMIKAIKEAGGNPRYTEFPDANHFSWPLAYDTPGLLDWLFNQKRSIR